MLDAAPEVAGIAVEMPQPRVSGEIIPLQVVSPRRPEPTPSRWIALDRASAADAGRMTVVDIDGRALAFARVAAQLYAYAATCPACAGSMDAAALDGTQAACPACARSYDLALAGRCSSDATPASRTGAAARRRARCARSDCGARMMQPQTPAAQTTGAWQRILQRRPPLTGERCEMCAEQIDERHGHVVNVDQRALMCVCRACYLLFTGEGAAGGHYRAVPDAYERIEPLVMSEAQWAELGIPVSPAFFFHNSQLGRAAAFYPSPAGATESLLPLDAWEAIVAANPPLQTARARTSKAC